MKWSWLLALLISLGPITVLAQRGREPAQTTYENRGEDGRGSGTEGYRSKYERAIYESRSSEAEKYYLQERYRQVLVKDATNLPQGELEVAAVYLAKASKSQAVRSLGGDLAFLSARVVGLSNPDEYVIGLNRLVAKKQFSVPYSLDRISVLVTGISQIRAQKMMAIASARVFPSPPTEPLVRALLKFKQIESQKLTEETVAEIGAALKPFENRLLILVAHHGSPTLIGNIVEGNQTVLIEMGSERVNFPAPLLARLASQHRVNLFIYGCESASSQHLGTKGFITAAAALQGIERLFDSPVATYGEVFSRLAGNDIQIVFDARLAENGIYLIAEKSTASVGLPEQGSPTWRISRVSASGDPISAPNYCLYADGSLDVRCTMNWRPPSRSIEKIRRTKDDTHWWDDPLLRSPISTSRIPIIRV